MKILMNFRAENGRKTGFEPYEQSLKIKIGLLVVLDLTTSLWLLLGLRNFTIVACVYLGELIIKNKHLKHDTLQSKSRTWAHNWRSKSFLSI